LSIGNELCGAGPGKIWGMIEPRMVFSQKLLEQCDIPYDPQAVPNFSIQSVVCDSRRCEEGSIFVAIPGVVQDGHNYIPEAVERGAQLVIAQRGHTIPKHVTSVWVDNSRLAFARLNHYFWGEPGKHMKLFGVTGTNGKTTSVFLMEAIFSKSFVTGVMGTIHQKINGKTSPSQKTTLDPEELHPLLHQMREAKCEAVMMEVSSHALDQDRVEGLKFDAMLWTNFTQDHLDYHGSLEVYFEAKAKALNYLKIDGKLILNHDDPSFQKIQKRWGKSSLTYGFQKDAFLRADRIQKSLEGSEFQIICEGQSYPVHTSLVGDHNIYNILGAVTLAYGCGIPLEESAQAINEFSNVPGRLERIPTDQAFRVFIDYAHTEDGLRQALSALRPFATGRLLLLFGCGGDRDRDKRPKMAKAAESFADHSVITSDNPRSENPRVIVKDICAGFSDNFSNYDIQLDRRKAIRQVLLRARKGDVVLLAGKGHEDYQIIGEKREVLSDKAECEKILRGL